jgi:carboxypeptidase Taq
MADQLQALRTILAEVSDINRASAVLAWDQETYMPRGGVEGRADQLATLRRLAHERFTSDEVGRLLEEGEATTASLEYDSFERSLVRVTRRDYERARKLPATLVEEVTRASSTARPAWIAARQESHFATFAPYLKRNVELNREVADALGYETRPFDALLERSEPGMTTAQLEVLFARLKEAIVPLVRAIGERRDAVDDSFLYGEFDQHAQLDFALATVREFGYDLERGRQDLSVHPFCIGFGPGDVRITTRVDPGFLSMCLFGSMHESGHAMYNQGIDRGLDRTPLWQGASPGVHESQSRLWENLVGRSRSFWRYRFNQLQGTFPNALDSVDAESFYRAVNKVQPSLIRVEADEVTYNLHILLRFELENDLLERKITVDELPAAWNAKMEEYLGVSPPNDGEGVLQDTHWSGVHFGTFPGYTLGNLIGAQIMVRIRADLPDLDATIGLGEFQPLLSWLQQNIYGHGRKLTPPELLERITGEELSVEPWIAYVQAKFSEIYGLARVTT